MVTFKPMPHSASPCLLLSLLVSFLCQAGYVNGNPSGSRLGNRSKKPTWRSGVSPATTLPTIKELRISLCSSTALATQITYVMITPPTPRPSRQPDSLPWELATPQDKAYFWERIEAPLPPFRPRCNFIHPRQLSPFLERLESPFSSDEIL